MGEFEGGDEAGLLVQAAEVTDKVDDVVLLLEGFPCCNLNRFQYVNRVYLGDIYNEVHFSCHMD